MYKPSTAQMPVALTIAGSDSGGGAGIQADLKTFSARGVFGVSAITCLTAQNPDSVTEVTPVTPDFLREQIRQITRFFSVGAAKTGMLFSAELIREVAGFLREHPQLPVVIDPVMVSTSGATLLQPEAVRALREELLPLAALITPNLDEAKVLLGEESVKRDRMTAAARALADRFGRPVLLKGGHLEDNLLLDVFAEPGGTVHGFEEERIQGIDTHGSGCTLAAAIAAELAKGAGLRDAVTEGRAYLRRAMSQAIHLGDRRFIRHETL